MNQVRIQVNPSSPENRGGFTSSPERLLPPEMITRSRIVNDAMRRLEESRAMAQDQASGHTLAPNLGIVTPKPGIEKPQTAPLGYLTGKDSRFDDPGSRNDKSTAPIGGVSPTFQTVPADVATQYEKINAYVAPELTREQQLLQQINDIHASSANMTQTLEQITQNPFNQN